MKLRAKILWTLLLLASGPFLLAAADAEKKIKLSLPARNCDLKKVSQAFGDKPTTGPFKGLMHLGADVLPGAEGAGVYACADGVVKQAGVISPDKNTPDIPTAGNFVIIEHQYPAGANFCSVYAHLGKDVYVVAGDKVACGQRIGSVGKAYSEENGNAPAQLHFAIHQGSFLCEVPLNPEFVEIKIEKNLVKARVTRIEHGVRVTVVVEDEKIELPWQDDFTRRFSSRALWFAEYASDEQNVSFWQSPGELFEEQK